MARLTDDELGALVDAEQRAAIGFDSGKLADQRRKAEYFFYGEAKEELAPPSVPGRSSVVIPVVRNTIEAMLPQLMVKFTGGDTVVEFEPTEEGDEEKAKQATDYLNYLFFKKNNGHTITYSWFKDALKFKRGIIKVWWDERDEEKREEYRGLSSVELAQTMDDPEVEVTEQKSYPDEEDAKQRAKAVEHFTAQLAQAQQAAQQGNAQALQASIQIQAQLDQINQTPPALLYDITCKRTKTGGKICIENVPPEEFGISRKAKMDLQDSPWVFHKFKRTRSELISMGYSKALIDSLGNDAFGDDDNAETYERVAYDDSYTQGQSESLDESQRQFWVVEAYGRVDFDGDGIAELRKITRCGGKTLDNEITDLSPFVSICPVPEPHKFFGLSVADLAFEGQKVETALVRANLDNLYLEVNGRYFAVEGQVNLDDLLTSRPGGVVRVKNEGAVGRLDQGKGNIGDSMAMLEYVQSATEDSTGWSRQSMGNDAQGLRPETATKANIVTNKADMRLDLIARNFAEGFVELFRMMLKLVCQYQDKAANIRLSGKWVNMDPREWRNQFDVGINVGLGVGNKDQQIAHLMALFSMQTQAAGVGVVDPVNVYNTGAETAKAMGFKVGDKFFTRPQEGAKLPNPAEGQMQMEQMKLQAQAQIKQMEQQHAAQTEAMKMQMQERVDMNRQEMEARQKTLEQQQQAQIEQLRIQHDERMKAAELEFKRWEVSRKIGAQLSTARIGAKAKASGGESTSAPDDAEALDEETDLSAAYGQPGPIDRLAEMHAQTMQAIGALAQQMARPKTIIRGGDGRAVGVQ